MHTFDETRAQFRPYGLTCERWTPTRMGRPDRHNEIELNYLPGGSLTYLVQDRRVMLPAHRLAVFWGLTAHQIVDFELGEPYFVCTIPFSVFLEWNLPAPFVDRMLKGEVLVEPQDDHAASDASLFGRWIDDVGSQDTAAVMLLELRARLSRMALAFRRDAHPESRPLPLASPEISQVERLAVYIGRHFRSPIRAADIGRAVGLHPDYANAVFKRAFRMTLGEYITAERVAYASRQLVTTSLPVTEIAYASGFHSVSRFNAAFRKINGCTPREFRKA